MSDDRFRTLSLVTVVASIAAVLGVPALASAQSLVLTELMGRNATTLADGDGDFSDWVEVYNVTGNAVSLEGWSLTDDSQAAGKWHFPSREIAPRTAVIVFASGKNRRPVEGELHASFRLSGGGEFLGLFAPNGELASAYAPQFPEQFAHASFGFRMDSDRFPLLSAGAALRYRFPGDDALGRTWTEGAFDDASWSEGSSPIGFDVKEAATFNAELATDFGGPEATNGASVYIRTSFSVAAPVELDVLLLRMRYDGGFVAYLNGTEVARRNSPAEPSARSASTSEVAESRTFSFETIHLSNALPLLVADGNVLAIHAMNSSAADPDLLIVPELEGLRVGTVAATERGYFANPTPGWPNGEIYRGVAPEVSFSVPGQISSAPFTLELATPGSRGEIRYTTDRSDPDPRSPLYAEAITVDRNVEIRARAFVEDLVPSDVTRQMYARLAPDMADFSSDLPLVFFNSVGRPDPLQPGAGQVFVLERGADGQTIPTQPIEFGGQGQMWARGSSTLTHPKKSWRLEFRDRYGEDLDVSPLGMPADGDWLLYGAHIVDPSLIRNDFMYSLSLQLDRYAVRGRFCEVFLNGMDEPISRSDYVGVYSFFERIERHDERVAVERLPLDARQEPEVSGGYILKIDRGDADEKPFDAGGRAVAAFYPAADQITDVQVAWIKDYLDAFAAALSLPEVTDGGVPLDQKGYSEYIDVDSWIDHHLLNEIARNSDGLGLSTYLFKPRGEKLSAGPIWDFDRAVGAASTGTSNPVGWQCGKFFGGPWWGRLFSDPQFWLRYRELYLNRRSTTLSEANIRALIAELAAEIDEARVRNFDHWGRDVIDRGDWDGEVDFLAAWVAERLSWMDTRFVSAPGFSRVAGIVEPGVAVTLTRPLGNMAGSCDAEPVFPPPLDGEIYYTLNGPDPRTPAGGKHPSALLYDGTTIVIEQNVQIRARSLERGAWSDVAEAGYVTTVAPLALTEIMFNPVVKEGETFTASNFEFLEFQNVGDEPISLAGFAVSKPAVELTGSDVFDQPLETLAPGEYLLLVRNAEAFVARYGVVGGVKIGGEFASRNTLSNSGQGLLLTGPFGEEVFRFRYEDEWELLADSAGHSLVLIDPSTPTADYGLATSWRASAQPEGSPGAADPSDVVAGGGQRPGDFSQDGRLNIVDAVGLLDFLFRDATGPCSSAAGTTGLLDANGDGRLNVTDAVHTLDFVFGRGDSLVLGGDCRIIEDCEDVCTQP